MLGGKENGAVWSFVKQQVKYIPTSQFSLLHNL